MAKPLHEPGVIVDGFRLEEMAHQGGMATVWRVTRPDMAAPVLMKVPRIGEGTDPAAIVSFEMEQMIMPRLSGPHVPKCIAVGDFAKQPYIAIECIPGKTLYTRLPELPLPYMEVADIGVKIAQALDDLHRQHVVHLDIKPSNVMFRPTGEAVLLDFGLSHHDQLPDLMQEEFRVPFGTAPYMSPEQLHGVRNDPRSDLFALGVLLYFFSTGVRPFGESETLRGMRRRGYPAAAIREFCERIGVAKRENMIDLSLLEFCVREILNKTAWRRMAVLDPVKLVITDYPEGKTEMMFGENNPEVEGGEGGREMPFSRELWIEREDFMEEPSKKFFRLGVGLMVRLKNAYIIKGESFVKDADGNITEIHCTHLPESKSGGDHSGVTVKGTIHWVSVPHAQTVEVRQYDRLFKVEDPSNEDNDFKEYLNPDSLQIITAYVEPDLATAEPGRGYQFIRKGYFTLDKHSTPEKPVFNRTVTLKDGWKK